MNNKNFDELWERELWTQTEVANYFRVVPSTIKNWRDQGLLSYWQAPGSSRVLYYSRELKDFRNDYTFFRKGGDREQDKPKLKKGKGQLYLPKTDKVWRI